MVKCDQCDKPAVRIVRDAIEDTPEGVDHRTFSASKEMRSGCEDHPPARARMIFKDGRVV